MTATVEAAPPAATTTTPGLRARVRGYGETGHAVSRLALVTLRRGVLPAGVLGLRILFREGQRDLHWKVLGDALVRVLERAGPLTTKLGQVLATRSDVLPAAVCSRLEVLLDRQRPMADDDLRRALAVAYPDGAPFADLDPRPLGVGSVGQVHRAKLPDGRKVVVKVLRPGVGEAIERDLRSARALLPLVARLPRGDRELARRLLSRALDDLATGLRRETDLLAEADSLREFRRRLQRNPRVVVPECHRDLCRPGVLVMEALEGESLSAFRARAAKDPVAARTIAKLAFQEILQQVFEDGRFHADPHSGNLLVLPDGRLGIIDLGLTAEFGAAERKSITEAIRAFLARDPQRVIRSLLALGTAPEGFELDAFEREVLDVVRKGGEPPAGGLPGADSGEEPTRLERLVNELLSVARRHELEIPPSTTLLIKSLVTIEGVARSLDPDLDLGRAALPVILNALKPRWVDSLAFWRWGRTTHA